MSTVTKLKVYIRTNRPVGCRPYSHMKKADLLKLALELGYASRTTPKPTVAYLKKYVKENKLRGCRAYSGLKKAELLKLAVELGYRMQVTPKMNSPKSPKPRKTKAKAKPPKQRKTKAKAKPQTQILPTPPTKKDLKDLLRIYVGQSSDKPVPYISKGDSTQPFMLLHVLKKNSNDCHIKRDGNLDYGLQVTKGTDSFEITSEKRDRIRNEYEKCKSKGKMLVIPLTLYYIGGHTNMLIFNFHRNELERFEPHGYKTSGVPALKSQYIDLKCSSLARHMGLKYVSSKDIFSESHLRNGFQAYETSTQSEIVQGKYKIKDPGGFCTAWSYFYADIRLQYPKYSAAELTDEIYSVIGKNPQTLRHFIRGQMRFLEVEINKVNKRYPFVKFLNLDRKSKEYKEAKKLYQKYINERFLEIA